MAVLLVGAVATHAHAADLEWARGVSWYRAGRYGDAVGAFFGVVRRHPGDGLAWTWLGASAYQAGRFRVAQRALERAVRLRPRDPVALLWLGYARAALGDHRGAQGLFQRVIQLAPASPAVRYALWGVRAGRAWDPSRYAAVDPRTYAWMARSYNPRLSPEEALRIGTALVGYARGFNVDPRLVAAVIAVESGFNPRAVSRAGALGLGQLMPETARAVGVLRPFDPVENVYGTVRVLRGHLERYGYHNLPLALAAYNAGRGAVAFHGGIPPYSETQWYVYNVLSLYRRILDGAP
ncbi:MAG: lytic transglycosylase domain-containing protein [Armatimonadetes bacterium]|nr:lytic transglycosylase domain-containing protein [Armatimonadota bacterium]MDW8153002.1 lytic transglycosylase domain-containing protein [Armatimonadota bacterium]